MTPLPPPPPLPGSLPPPPPPPAVPLSNDAPQAHRAATDALVVALNVSKWFGDLVAVSDVSFTLGTGVTALLGPNGAGKSTMLRMLCGLASPSSGSVEILGMNPRTDPRAALHIGLAPQQESVFETLTAREFVEMSARLQGVHSPREAAEEALDVVELDSTDQRRLPTYSKGMRQRVKLAQAIVHKPRVIILDEPLTGLDPRQRLHMVDLFHRLGEQGRCVIVSSHVLEEVERFGSNVLVIALGRLAAQGDFRAIRDLMDDRPRRVRVRTDRPQSLAGALIAAGVVSAVKLEDDQVELDTDDARALAAAIAPLAKRESARLFEVRPLDEDLESVFRYLVGR
ncbi:MAG: ABC transporter ATP-binding protein [Acidimicrobiales bacterium]